MKQYTPTDKGGPSTSGTSVSYTHLDVYKRQVVLFCTALTAALHLLGFPRIVYNDTLGCSRAFRNYRNTIIAKVKRLARSME